MFRCLRTNWLIVVALVFQSFLGSLRVEAEEPYERFLERLKDERLFDLALAYLDHLESKGDLPTEFQSALELERGILKYQAAAMLSPSDRSRGQKLDEAEKALRAFLDSRKNHPRRGEARLKLGELLLQRADEAKRRSEDATQDNEEAAEFYDSAHQLFEATIQELAGILERIKGARTDPNDKRAVAYRQRVQQDLRQAQLLSAKSVEERGRSWAEGNSKRQSDLKTALQMFTDLYLKEQRMVGVRNYALFYRSEIQRDLGMAADAIDGFQRVADLEGVDVLRPLQTSAIRELVQLFVAQEKFPLAVGRADKWVAQLRPDEASAKETIDLKLELAQAKVAWSKALKKQDPDDRVASRLIRDARTELRSLLRIQGPHLEQTRDLLAELGVGNEDSGDDEEELPEVSSFAEATTEAQKRIERAESDALGIAILREQGKSQEAEELESKIRSQRKQALVLLNQALSMYGEGGDVEALSQARFSIAYLHLRQQEPWEALAVAQFVAQRNPRAAIGLKAASVSLGAFSDLLRIAGDDERRMLTAILEPYAKYLVETWPDSPEASAAAAALVQLALANGEWEKVEQFLAMAPATGDAMVGLRRDAGLSFYNRYLDEKAASGEESGKTQELKQRAVESLQIATSDLKAEQLDDGFANAVNALARLYLSEEKTAEAAKLLLQGDASPVRVIENKSDALSSKTAMNSYRTAIQLVVSQLASGTLTSDVAVRESQKYIQGLQKLAQDLPDGQKTLTGIFYSLAKDLKTQLAEAKQAERRKRLSEATIMLAEQAANAEDFNTKYWAVDTMLSIAEELAEDRATQDAAKAGFAKASQVLKEILQAQKANAEYIQPTELEVQVQLLLAKAYRGSGEFSAALDVFESILKERSTLLSVQIEAAKTYQDWGDAVDARLHTKAVSGGRLNQATNKNTIWGWGRIGQILQGKTDFEEQFYLARYELARSEYKIGVNANSAQLKKEYLERAKKSVISTATLYPTLGGESMKGKYDALLKAMQKQLGEPATGLAGLAIN